MISKINFKGRNQIWTQATSNGILILKKTLSWLISYLHGFKKYSSTLKNLMQKFLPNAGAYNNVRVE